MPKPLISGISDRRDPRYDILFQPLQITPFIEQRLWDDRDFPALAHMAGAMKSHGALAGIQLAYSGINGPNHYSREVPMAVSGGPILTFASDPVQARTLDRADIRDLRRWFRNAVRRSQQAGFDLICFYGAHGFGIFQHFSSRATNLRTDDCGGSLENRARFIRDVIEEARDETTGELAMSLRLSLHEAGKLGFCNAEVRDFIGAARPSIADPFLPLKIDQGRTEDIRECIGCNICVSGDMTHGISRCTQNTAFMEEWRKGWHPERARPKGAPDSVLVVGGGPTGLEAAHALGKRGYQVTLAEAAKSLGGRISAERRLPGLSAWGRVADCRTGQLAPMAMCKAISTAR